MKKLETTDYYLILRRLEKGSDAEVFRTIRRMITQELPSLRSEVVRLKKRNGIMRSLIAEVPELLADYKHLAPDADGKTDPVRNRRVAKITKLLERLDPPQTGRIYTGADLGTPTIDGGEEK
jgi:hypothetical protein